MPSSDHFVQKNGLILIATRDQFFSYDEKEYPDWKYNLKERMTAMEKQNKWKFVEKIKHENYIQVNGETRPGHTLVFKKL